MAQLYNPDLMSEQELKETFVARQDVLDEILSLIQRQPEGAGVQHAVIIAPRGMGKTTLLLMVQFGIEDQGLAPAWQYVRFAEESYGVYDLADFWMHVLEHLSADAGEPALQTKAEELKRRYKDAEDLAEAALALLKDWCKEHNRRLVLLVDNLDLILSQIDDEQENARLRQVLMNDGCMMLIGGATTFFQEARAYDQPLYNFFKIIHLRPLSHPEILELLKQRAAMDGKPDFEGTLEANRTRIRVLEYFTGGNPRLVLMLYRVLAKSEVLEVRRGMEELLDQVTPFYKDKMESLPAQQRKILDHIARVSAQTHEGTTPTDIAAATRMTPNGVSSQLKRLADLGYVRSANIKGRKAYYTLSEPLYAIWHQMRFGRDARRKMQWLVNFLQGWYRADEIIAESERLGTRFEQLLAQGLMEQARSTLEHRRYLVEAASGRPESSGAWDQLVQGYLAVKDHEALKGDLLRSLDLGLLAVSTLEELEKQGCITEEQFYRALPQAADVPGELKSEAEGFTNAYLAVAALEAEDTERALQHSEIAIRLKADSLVGWIAHSVALNQLGRHNEALRSTDSGLALAPNSSVLLKLRAAILTSLGRNEEAIAILSKLVAEEPDDLILRTLEATVLLSLGRNAEALDVYDYCVSLDSDRADLWASRGDALMRLGLTEESLASFDRAISIDPSHPTIWWLRAAVLIGLQRFDEALFNLHHASRELKEERLNELRPYVELMQFVIHQARGESELALESWRYALEEGLTLDDWVGVATSVLIVIAGNGHLDTVTDLISSTRDTGVFLPLQRAIDFIRSGDLDPVDRLSPEVRSIVEQIAKRLTTKSA